MALKKIKGSPEFLEEILAIAKARREEEPAVAETESLEDTVIEEDESSHLA